MQSELQLLLQKIVNHLTNENISVELEISTDASHGDYTTNVSFQVSKILKISPREAADKIIEKLPESSFRVKQSVIEESNSRETDPSTSTGTISNLSSVGMTLVEVAGPGFINFYLSKDYFLKNLQEMLANPGKIGKTEALKGKKISVEFTDPNPFKEFHIGHVYTNTVGESIARLFEANGAIVWRADYFGDVGMHVAKSIYGILQKFKMNVRHSGESTLVDDSKIPSETQRDSGQARMTGFKNVEELEKVSLSEKAKFLGQCYAYGATAYEEDKQAAEEIKKLNKIIFIVAQKMWEKEKGITPHVDYQKGESLDEKEFAEIYELYTKGRRWSLDYFDSIYARLGMRFDGYYPESIAGEKGYALVKAHIADGIFEEHEGAIIFSKEKSNLHTRVFINSLGLPTYEAKELGLAPWKYDEFHYDESYIITGNEIIEYFKVLVAAMTMINPELGKKTHHVGHGMVRLPEGKMSSRTGKVITGEWVLDEAVKKAEGLSRHSGLDTNRVNRLYLDPESPQSKKEILNHSTQYLLPRSGAVQDDELKEIAEQVGIGAVKYAFLKSGIGKDIEFDFETSLSLTGNSGPYVQYTYVRTQSILEKAKNTVIPSDPPAGGESRDLSPNNSVELDPSMRPSDLVGMTSEESLLIRLISQCNSVVEEAATNLAPSTLCTYLYEVAKQFNLFYQTHRIVDATTSEEQKFRLNLTAGVGMILSVGLGLLGIAAPKRM